jgi:hypothetical protein
MAMRSGIYTGSEFLVNAQQTDRIAGPLRRTRMNLSESGLDMNTSGSSPQPKARTIQVRMVATLEQLGPGGLASLRCLRCGHPLELHQPSADLPERLIGVCSSCCDDCGSWHILNSFPGREEIVVALLPPCEAFLDAFLSGDDAAAGLERSEAAALSLEGPVPPEE